MKQILPAAACATNTKIKIIGFVMKPSYLVNKLDEHTNSTNTSLHKLGNLDLQDDETFIMKDKKNGEFESKSRDTESDSRILSTPVGKSVRQTNCLHHSKVICSGHAQAMHLKQVVSNNAAS